MVQFNNKWDALLAEEFKQDYYLKIRAFLKSEYANPAYPIYPNMYDIFNAFKRTDYDNVKVVILGQDPYHEPGQAHGLSFSVKDGTRMPPSLVNIFKEYTADLGYPFPTTGDLTPWAQNGVLLLNSVLTVRGGIASSHKGIGWELFTDHVISLLNEREKPVVFLLWGRFARNKKELITNPIHCILEAAHPSPLSANSGFFGCRHFSKTNAFLGDNAVNWRLP